MNLCWNPTSRREIVKVDRTELVYKLSEAINVISEEKNPSQHLIDMGEALKKIGHVLKNLDLKTCRKIIGTIKFMNDAGLLEEESDKQERKK